MESGGDRERLEARHVRFSAVTDSLQHVIGLDKGNHRAGSVGTQCGVLPILKPHIHSVSQSALNF